MSENALRATPAVNIDEFERRLRATGSSGAAQEDPLAELARLLGVEEPPRAEAEAPKPRPEAEAPKPRAEPEAPKPRPETAAPRPVARSEAPTFGKVVNVDFGGDSSAGAANPPPVPLDVPDFEAEIPAVAGEAAPLVHAEVQHAALETPPAPQSRRKAWAMAAVILIGAAGVAGAWAYRGGVPGLSARVPPFIMAAAGPTKVQPPSEETVASPNDVASLLGKDQPAKPAAATVVSSVEQPVDLNDRAKAQASAEARAAAQPANPPTIAAAPLVVVAAPPTPPPPASAAPAPAATAAAPTSAPAAPAPAASAPAAPSVAAASPSAPAARSIGASSSSSPVASSDGAPTASIGPGAVSPAGPGPGAAQPVPPTPFPEPKRVKTISVRPDGSVINAAAPDHAAQQPLEPAYSTPPVNPPKPVVRPADAVAAEPATPKLDLPAKPPGKTTTRVPIAKIDTTAATATSQSPEAPLQITPRENAAKKREANARIAAADAAPPAATPPVAAPAENKAEKTPLKSLLSAILPGQDSADSAPHPTATASAETAPAGAGDNFSVQLAAPGTEAEAQSASARLKAKYSSQLGGLEPGIHMAALKDKTVYRVRVGPLSHSAAIALCEKLKAAGGACFLARE